jgi:hypothetical protein
MCNLYIGSIRNTFHRCFLPTFGSFDEAVSEKIFFKSTNQKQELPVAPMFVSGSVRNAQPCLRPGLLTDLNKLYNLYRGPSIDASYQVSVHLAKRFQSYKVLVHLAKRFQKRIFFISINQQQELLVAAMFADTI